jgi:dienelactone hydrolase
MGATPADFNMTAWRERHPVTAIDSIVSTTIASIRGTFSATKVGAVGYCFGGKYIARFLAPGKGLDAGFTAHPSGVVAEEWGNVSVPLSIAFGGKSFPFLFYPKIPHFASYFRLLILMGL